MANPTNLNEYYQSQGQALPTVQARAPLYAQYGGTGAYSGTAAQNSFLLGKLTSGAQSPASSTSASPTTTAGAIGTVPPVTVPPVSPIPNVSTELATYLNNLNAQVNTNQAAVTAKEGEIAQQKTDAQLLADQLTNQTADRIAAEDQQGLPALGKDLQDLTNLSRSQTAQYIQGIQNSELNGGLAANVNAKQNFLNRQNAIDSMLTNSLISAKQGDISNAQAQVDRAISLKYDPIKQQLQNKLDFIQMNYNELDRADKKLADVKTQQWNLQMKQIELQQQQQQDIQNIALQAAQNGAPNSVLKTINGATSVADATSKAAGYFQDPLDVKLKKLQIQKVQADLRPEPKGTNIKIVKIDGKDYIQNPDGTLSLPVLPKTPQNAAAQQAAQDKIKTINSLIDHKGLAQTVGTTGFFGRGGTLNPGRKQDFIASVEQLRGELTLQNLIDSKAQGATFGALSEGELRLLANSASKIGTWAIADKNGKVTGYQASEKAFKTELDNIRKLTERALINSSETDQYLDTVDSILQQENNPYSQAGYMISQ